MAQKQATQNNRYNQKSYNQQGDTNQKFRRAPLQKTQCLACKTFGHKTQDCNIVGKILAVLDLHKKKPELCQRILQSHINKNNPARRLAIIRTLQNMDILSPTQTPEDHLTNADVDDHITATVNATDCSITTEMLLEHATENEHAE